MGSRIVVADDSETILEIVQLTLNRAGYEPAAAADGAEALAAVREHQPELLIVDATMPVLDGYEVVRTIREELAGRGPYVIMMTASDRAVDRERAAEAGVDEFLAKPFSPIALRDRVVEILGGGAGAA